MSQSNLQAKRLQQRRDKAENKKRKKQIDKINWKSNLAQLSMCLPAMAKLLLFQYIPIVGILIAFQDYNPLKRIFGSKWIGFKNFEFFFSSGRAAQITFNTIAFNAIFIITGLIFAVAVALLLHEITNKVTVKAFQTVMFFPFFISWALVGMILTGFLNDQGMATRIVETIFGVSPDFYNNPNAWWIILPLVNVWKGSGVSAIIYYANMLSISKEYYEAAYLDGASKMQCARHITIPFLKPMIITLTLMSLGGIIRADFGIFYFATRNQTALYPVTTVIDTYVFRALEQSGDVSMGAAIGLFQSVVGCILVLVSNAIVRKNTPELAQF